MKVCVAMNSMGWMSGAMELANDASEDVLCQLTICMWEQSSCDVKIVLFERGFANEEELKVFELYSYNSPNLLVYVQVVSFKFKRVLRDPIRESIRWFIGRGVRITSHAIMQSFNVAKMNKKILALPTRRSVEVSRCEHHQRFALLPENATKLKTFERILVGFKRDVIFVALAFKFSSSQVFNSSLKLKRRKIVSPYSIVKQTRMMSDELV